MLKKSLSLLLTGLLIHSMNLTILTFANTRAEKALLVAGRMKADVAKLGVGPRARVKVKLQDKTELDGYISEVSKDHFVVTNAKTGTAMSIAYTEATQVKGNKLSTGTKIGIGVAAIAAAVALTLVLNRSDKRNSGDIRCADGIRAPCP